VDSCRLLQVRGWLEANPAILKARGLARNPGSPPTTAGGAGLQLNDDEPFWALTNIASAMPILISS
jgi:hypothetical protein